MYRFLTIAFACLLAMPVHALCNGPGLELWLTDAERADLDTLVAQTPYAEGLFWQATKGDQTLSIIGTMHLPDARLVPLVDMVQPRLTASDLMLVEATPQDQLAIQTYIANDPAIFTITSGPSLIDRLDDTTWAAIAQAAEARGVPSIMAARMQPWFLSMTLSIPPCAAASMAGGQGGFDNLLMQQADGQMEIRALEDWRTLLDLMRDGSFDDQLDALRLSLIAPDIQDAVIVSLLDSYFDARPGYSWHISRFTARFVPDLSEGAFEAEFASMEKLLLTDRNRDWIPVIEAASAQHAQVFIAFGAAHLVGDNGVLSLLAQNGWTIERLDG